MSAIIKYIAIHESASPRDGIKTCLDYINDASKTDILNAVGYIQDKEKTTIQGERTILVTPISCNTLTADLEFQWCKDRYRNNKGEHLSEKIIRDVNNPRSKGSVKKSIDAVHIIQSFSSDANNPNEVHSMGLELVSRLYPGHAAVVASHINKENISDEPQYHNHIIVCSYNQEGNRKIQYNLKEIHRARDLSDQICLEHGQRILESDSKALSYGEWKSKNINNNSWKDELCSIIEQEKMNTDNWLRYKVNMKLRGYEIIENHKSVTYTIPHANRKVRDRTLGETYTKTSLERFWSAGEKEIIETIKMERDDDTLIWKMVNISKIKQPKLDKGKYRIWISQYDIFGRKRSALEMILLVWFKTIVLLLLLIRDLFQQREEIYTELYQEYNKAIETLKKIRLYEITSKEELKKRMNKIGSEISHLKKQITEMKENAEAEDNLESTESITSLIEFERLQALLKNNNMVYADLSKIKRIIERAENPEYLFELLKTAKMTEDKESIQIKEVDNISDMPEEERGFERQLEESLMEDSIIEENKHELE